MRKTCSDRHCFACAFLPPALAAKIIKNLCLEYCKVSPGEVTEAKLAKKPLKKDDAKQSKHGKNRKV